MLNQDPTEHVIVKSSADIERMRAACRLAVETLVEAAKHVRAGATTEEINTIVHAHTISHGAIPAPLNYRGFPKSVCTSINDVVCHGIPSRTEVLREGDIINIDVTTILDGFHGDTSRTFIVGEASETARRLVQVTEECLMRAIRVVKPGARIRDIGGVIQDYAESFGFGVVREYVGHGIGREFHEPPQVPHYRAKGANPRLRSGMIFTIEPMINEGTWETELDRRDGWTVRTADRKLSAQFEHTILVTDDSYEILTPWPT